MLEADVDVKDILEEEDVTIIYAEPDQFHRVQEAVRGAGIEEFTIAETLMLPQTEIALDEEAQTQFEKWSMPLKVWKMCNKFTITLT